MTEISKDFLKLIATLIIVLTIFLAVLNNGILESLFALKTYAEPLTLLDHLAAAYETAGSCPGECSLTVRTSGLPYILNIYKENGRYYASIDATLVEEKSNVKFLPNQEKPVFTKPLISDCIISEQSLTFTEGLIQDVTIRKVLEGSTCKIFIESKAAYYDFNVSLGTNTLLIPNGTTSTTTVTVSLLGNLIAPEPVNLKISGLPPGVGAGFDIDSANPTFTSTITVSADPSAAAGTYELTITGTSGDVSRSAKLEIEVSPTLYTFILNSQNSIADLPLTNVQVNLSGITKYTSVYDEFTSNIIYSLVPGNQYSVKVENPFADPQGPRDFSHFRDLDCKGNNTGYYLDTALNPYTFDIPSDWTLTYSRKMTAFYKTFTQIRNLEFDNVTNTIEGNLLDEDFNSISEGETSYQSCGVPITINPNRNVILQYLDACGGLKPLSSVTSSFAQNRFYDKFDKDITKWDTNDGNWNVANGELDNSGIGDESIQTKWNFWNSSSDGNNNLEVSVKLSGSNVSIRIFDSINDYYLQTNDSYGHVYLWVNGALKQSASPIGIFPNRWNVWRIRQNDSYLEFYINDQKLFRYTGVPIMDSGRIMLRTLNSGAAFDNVISYSGSWSYNFVGSCSMKEVKAIYTPAPTNWFYQDTSSFININPASVPCKLNVTTQVDATSLLLPGVEVNVTDGVSGIKYTKTTPAPNATVQYLLFATPNKIHNITVNSTFNSRDFSHFVDYDCSNTNPLYILDNGTNPYWFSMCGDKNITAQYKSFTYITNASGYPNTFNYDYGKRTISGELLDDVGNPIITWQGTNHTRCTSNNVFDSVDINRNVTLEYYKNGRWYYIGVNDSQDDGSWYYNWGCVCNATKLRANYTSSNWFYMSSSTETNVVCPCKLTVLTQVDTLTQPLSGVSVNVSNNISRTDAFGIAEYYLFPGNYYIDVDNPFNSRSYSHFFDSDCSKPTMNQLLDNASKPYTFGMYDRDKSITVQYKTLTNITDTLGNTNKFEYNGTYIKGRLRDERNNLIRSSENYHPTCGSPLSSPDINSNVTLEYFNGVWNTIATVASSKIDGSWSYAWTCGTTGALKLRATYIPIAPNWLYNETSTELPLNCNGILDVYAFAASNPVAAKVAIGMGDANWDGKVNETDFDLVNSHSGAVPGSSNWNIDYDMNLDNKININDIIFMIPYNNTNTIINTTHFSISLPPGTYKLRAKYNNQIQNNASVVINAAQLTTVNFNFLTCDGSSALNCSAPNPGSGNFRNLTGGCGRSAPTFAKIDCNGIYNSHMVCNATSLCNNINPTVGNYSVSSTNIFIGNSFSINVSGYCPSDLPGNCLIECGITEPNGSMIYLDTWNKTLPVTTPSVTCEQTGDYVVAYCSEGTDFIANRGWNMTNNTNTVINCKGNLDVYAFAGGNPVAAKVAIGLGDVNWDGVVNSSDMWFFNNTNPNSCLGTFPGDRLWNIDCDMDLNNKINVLDYQYVIINSGKNVPIGTTNFNMNLAPGTYTLRAKYNNQILNQSVVVNAGMLTTVNFNFLSTCDGFSALDCNSSNAALPLGDSRNLTGTCDRTNAKIDCNGIYNSNTVCNTTSLCNNINPRVGNYSVSSKVIFGGSFSINVSGKCPSDFPGKCLVECGVVEPNGSAIYLDTWSNTTLTTMPSVTCEQTGDYVVTYCSEGTDFIANRGWNLQNSTQTVVNCKGNLDVYAFANANPAAIPVAAKVAIGMGDANWDGKVDVLDLSKIGLIAGSQPRPGDPDWDLDCDMNLDNVINVLDFPYVSLNLGKNTSISNTYFNMGLAPGTYQLRAKYDNQILNNMSVVVNAGQMTTVNFTFSSTCNGFSALNCSPPGLRPGDYRNTLGFCGRTLPTFAKIDCDGNYNSHMICNTTVSPGPMCSNMTPTIGPTNVPITTTTLGNPFFIFSQGLCPSDLPGNCLIECAVLEPNNSVIYLDVWSKPLSGNPTTPMPPVKCEQRGNYVVRYCLIGTDFVTSRGWNATSSVNRIVNCI